MSVPVPRGRLPFIGHLKRLLEYKSQSQLFYDSCHEECGPIYRIKLLKQDFVVTCNPEHAKRIFMGQGNFPFRNELPFWKRVYDSRGWPAGIPWATGDQWVRQRRVLNSTVLQLAASRSHAPDIAVAVDHFMAAIGDATDPASGQCQADVKDLMGLTMLEIILRVVLGVDARIATAAPAKGPTEFIHAVEEMFAMTRECDNSLWRLVGRTPPSFGRLATAWDRMINWPSALIAPILEASTFADDGTAQLPSSVTVPGGLLSDDPAPQHVQLLDGKRSLLKRLLEDGLSREEVTHVAVQSIAASVDTTGQTFEFLISNLAAHPKAQDAVAEEVGALVAKADPPAAEGLPLSTSFGNRPLSEDGARALPFSMATVRESMRITPTIGVHLRTLVEAVDLGDGVHLPKGQLVLINSARLGWTGWADDARTFRPERHLEKRASRRAAGTHSSEGAAPTAHDTTAGPASGEPATVDGAGSAALADPTTSSQTASVSRCPFTGKTATRPQAPAPSPHPYSTVPFGHGPRKCAGAGLAQLALQIATAALCSRFVVLRNPAVQIPIVERSLNRFAEPITPHLTFHPRNSCVSAVSHAVSMSTTNGSANGASTRSSSTGADLTTEQLRSARAV
eukprot:TRINITY_DN12286_c0_g1_i1.p1 TRINITY_DN12286_c0_g1~~TRINITY_DN12286_c0_g1_i1.p1  ORF type:complete len:623 (+),score=91.32 TRINITY_DN12286_c0_g1_i1:55-1923(+)